MARATLVFHHTHTSDSNRFEADVRGIDIQSHVTDYVAIAQSLPASYDAVFVKTDHWRTSPAYFSRLEARLDHRGTDLERFDRCVRFVIDGTTAIIVNGVETAVETERRHVTVVGLPIEDEGTYHRLSVDEVLALGRRGGWIAPAHIGMPLHRYPPSFLRRLVPAAMESGVTAALGYSTGYTPWYNRIARNDLPFQSSVTELAEQLNVPLVPELDTHAVLPDGLAGCGILPVGLDGAGSHRGLVSRLLEVDLFLPSGYRCGISLPQLLKNYAALSPVPVADIDYRAEFERSLPDADHLAAVSLKDSIVSL